MAKIKVTCDSTCDLTKELYNNYHIDVLPLGICLGDDLRFDGVDVTAQELYDYAQKTGTLPKTSAISVGVYADCFQKYIDEGCQIIHISLSSDISSCYQNACIAASQFPGDVFVVDSKSLSSGSGHLALLAVELAAADYRAQEIYDALNDMKSRIDVSFVLQTLDYLHKGGRCSGIAAFGANALRLRPEIVVGDGKMHVGKKFRGDMEKSIMAYVRARLANQDNIQLDRIFVTHSGVPAELVAKVMQLVRELQPFEQVIETKAGSTISSHCGPRCLGLAFFRTNRH